MADIHTVNAIIKSALDYVELESPIFFNYVNRTELETKMQAAFNAAIPDEYHLNDDVIDFPAILLQMVQELQDSEAWKDTAQTAVGQTILRNISAGLSYLQFAMVRATQNAYMKPGSSKETVYAAMNYLGVNIRRKVPAKIKVRLSVREHFGPLTIPQFTQFTIDGVSFFNRRDVVYTEYETSKEVELVQGQIFSMEGTADGIEYEKVEIGYENFNISNEDVYVFVNGEEWKKSGTLRPWMSKKKEKVFISHTLDTGNVSVQFGNNVFAKRLSENDEIRIVWAETMGAKTPTITTAAYFTNNALEEPITGQVLSGVYGFDDELPISFYQNVGPSVRASNEVAVTRSSYITTALNYPKIRDALFRGQAEIAPNKRNWMNIAEATVLTTEGGVLGDVEWADFISYMGKNSMYQVNILRRDPLIIPIDIKADVYCVENSDLSVIRPKLISSILEFNSAKQGSIGYSYYASDINTLLEGEQLNDTLRSQISYVDKITLAYSSTVDLSSIGDFGIRNSGDILADYWHYIRFNTIDLSMRYTTRRVLQRRDITSGLVSS